MERATTEPASLMFHLSYWKDRLGDSPAVVQLPTDRPRQTASRLPTAIRAFALPPGLAGRLEAFARSEDDVAFTTLLAAFHVLCHRYTGQDDIVIGTPVRVSGGSLNALPLRTDVSGDPSFHQLRGRVRQVLQDAYAHQDVPFERLVEDVAGLSAAANPFFTVMFAGGNGREPAPDAAGAGSSDGHVLSTFNGLWGGIELLLTVDGVGRDLRGTFEYDPRRLDEASIDRMAGHFRMLLEGILANPHQRLSRLPLLTDSERHQIVVEWNDTRTDFPRESCLHELFEANVRRQPNAVALLFRDQQISYTDLNRQANRLAHHLRALGVGPEVRVAICVERSVEMVVGLLGILKAGGAYVPLDPAYPRERLAFMLEDAKVSVLVTQQRLLAALPPQGARPVCLDTGRDVVSGGSEENASSGVSAENLAYVIYTSGSTGRPKGIALRHSGVVNNLVDLNRSFGVGPEDRILAISSPSFDMCVYEILGMLAAGGAIVMPEAALASDPAQWAELIVRHQVTVWNSAPPLLEMLVNHVENRPQLRPRSIRVAILGGDWVPVTLPDRLKALADDVRVIVLGGATEASIHSIVYPVDRTDPTWRSIPYGRPMANQRAYILDSHLEPVPIGVPGELHIGGIGLARGYFDRPDLTAEKFVPNPFSHEGDRIYKTGDLARYMADGNIELIGRMDFQVKIHGHRIELGEIAAALKQYPAVQQAVVLVRGDEPAKKRLVAYVVCEGPSQPRQAELRSFLKERLPRYMVPSVFVLLDRLPLSPNGKVDRRALPLPDWGRPELTEAFVPPRNALERLLCEMWQEILGVERVGVHDEFVALGGSSIQGAVFINRLQERLGAIIHVVAVFDAPTVADLAGYLTQHYEDAVARVCGSDSLGDAGLAAGATAGQRPKIDASAAQQLRQLLRRKSAPEA
jgi:amino acid adenylation domain-containing protein